MADTIGNSNTSYNGTPISTVPNVGMAQYNVPNTQALGTINNSGNLNVPPAPIVPNAVGSLTAFSNQAQVDAQNKQAQADNATNSMNSLAQQLLGYNSDLAGYQQQYDTAGLGKKVNDLQALQAQQTAQYIQGLNNIELAKNTRQEANAQSVMLNRQHGIDALLTGAQLQSAQGNVEYANNLIKNALDLKYEPIKAQLEYQKAITEQLNTKAATAQTRAYDLKIKQIDQNVASSKDAITAGNLAATNGTVDQSTVYNANSDLLSGKITVDQYYKELGIKQDGTASTINNIDQLSKALSQQESGNNYSAVNPDSGALGKYQLMPFNLQKYAGLADTPANRAKFLADPALQDAAHMKLLQELNTTYKGDIQKITAAYYGGAKAAAVVGTPEGDKPQMSNGREYPSVNSYVNQVLATGKQNDYNHYGLLANTSFNPQNAGDNLAYAYLNKYIKDAAFPSALSIGISTRAGGNGAAKFAAAAKRAGDLYFEATGQSLPDVNILKANKQLIVGNNKIANNLNIQEGTINKNFSLAIQNLDKNNISQSAQPINAFINSIKNLMGDPNVAQYLTQNGTIQNEVGNLIALKNATGTTVADKLASAGLVPKNASEEQQKAILKILLQEAQNGFQTIQSVSGDLYKQIDPLEQDPNNPNRGNNPLGLSTNNNDPAGIL